MNQLQEVILSIACDVDKLLRENDIPYFIDGGTALGAIRHGGFIPWDDDFDIAILPEHYQKFVEVCRTKLDGSKYSFCEAEVDWPMHISKIKLKGTHIDEIDAYPMDDNGIFIDVFCYDNASNIKIVRYFQWLCNRLWVVMMLATKPYTTNSLKKKIALSIVKLFNSKKLRRLVRNLGRTRKKTNIVSVAWDRTRGNWNNYYYPRHFFKNSRDVNFEGVKFPVVGEIEEYLTKTYGDYLTLPPVEDRVGLHVKSVDFGDFKFKEQ